jgi:hypothetical protein
MIVVEHQGEKYRLGEVLLNARPYQAGRFVIHRLDDEEIAFPVWAWQVKYLYRTQHINGDFCREHDLEVIHGHLAGVL